MWALSNREDKPVLVSTLNAIKDRCGAIETRWFMSDMAQQYYSAWKEFLGLKVRPICGALGMSIERGGMA